MASVLPPPLSVVQPAGITDERACGGHWKPSASANVSGVVDSYLPSRIPIRQDLIRQERNSRATLYLSAVLGVTATCSLTPAFAVPEQDFQAKTTRQLVDLCSTPQSDPAFVQAQQFCQGFAAGALSYYRGASAPDSKPRYCNLPNTRQDATNAFVAWADAHPQYASDNPANTLFRFLDANYRCGG